MSYLAQDLVFEDHRNTSSGKFGDHIEETPYLLGLRREPRRYITRLNNSGNFELQFGSGTNQANDMFVIPQISAYKTEIPV